MSVRVRRVTTTRAGGVSAPPYDTFNLGDHVGDDPAAVSANRKRLAAAIGLGADGVVWMNQVHGDRVVRVDGPLDAGVGGSRRYRRIGDDHTTIGIGGGNGRLCSRFIEPTPAPGWSRRFTQAESARKKASWYGRSRRWWTPERRPRDISVLFGPSVSGRNYEVPAAMADEVEAALPGSRTTTSRGTPGLDLRAGIARQLKDLGITAIDADPRCTVDDRSLFSHRRDAPTGRIASVVWME